MSLWAVALTGTALTPPVLVLWGVGAAISVATGAALATANLWALAKGVSALLPTEPPGAGERSRGAWALVAGLKMVALLGVLWLLMRYGFVSPLPTLIGLLSLPFGIAIGSLVSDRSADSERDER